MVTLPAPAEMARWVPDEPAWVDLRGVLLSERCAVFAGEEPERGFVARSWDFPFAAVAGQPDPGTVRRCFHLLAAHLGERGKRPVWGALDSNLPSMKLAERLGFVPAAALVSLVRPREGAAA